MADRLAFRRAEALGRRQHLDSVPSHANLSYAAPERSGLRKSLLRVSLAQGDTALGIGVRLE